MIDLRSDTLTQPTQQMIKSAGDAELGDDGRVRSNGKGEDPTVNELEEIAAKITGKEDALLCPSGTMANMIALLVFCNRGETVGVDSFSHIFQSEKALFMEGYFGLKAKVYQSDDMGKPILESLRTTLSCEKVKLLCIENTLANKGGTCLSVEATNKICLMANDHHIPVHLDGARIFNAAASLNVHVSRLVEQVSSVQFCLSKGLGAPVGSMLCGSKNFILKARQIRKLLGGGMRQAGIFAGAGIKSLNNLQSLKKDHEKALLLSTLIEHNTNFNLNMDTVQSNIVLIDVSPCSISAEYAEKALMKYGLKVKAVTDHQVRMTIYKDIDNKAIHKAASIINMFFK